MRAVLGLVLACFLVWAVDTAIAARSSPYWKVAGSSDTLFAQQSDTSDAIKIDECSHMTAIAAGQGCDSVNMVTQISVDETNWVALTTGVTTTTNQNLATYGMIRNPLDTDVRTAAVTFQPTGLARYMRIIIKNNADTTGGNADTDTLVSYTMGVTCMR